MNLNTLLSLGLICFFNILVSTPTLALDSTNFTVEEERKLQPSTEETIFIKDVKLIQDNENSKIIIYLTAPIQEKPEVMATLETVTFQLNAKYEKTEHSNTDSRIAKKNSKSNEVKILTGEILENQFIRKVGWKSENGITQFEIKRKYYTPVDFVMGDDINTLVVQLPKLYFEQSSYLMRQGVYKHYVKAAIQRGPITATALEVDLSNKKISVKVGLPSETTIKSKDTLLNIVKKRNAFAGINANFFDLKIGNPLGTVITDGTWLVGPVYDRVAIGFSNDNMVYIDRVMLHANIAIQRGFRKKTVGMIDIDGLNIPFKLYNHAGLFTKNWDESKTELPKDYIAAVVEGNIVKKILTENVEIPEDGFVIAGKKDYLKNLLKRKDKLLISWISEPDWSDVKEAVSGGPYLLKHGEIYIDDQAQKFRFSKNETYAPRSAIGLDKDGKLFLVAVDGRKDGYSVGLTLVEFAKLLKELNLVEAINLDGGGSTELVVNGEIVSKLSEHHERKISNALLIFYK